MNGFDDPEVQALLEDLNACGSDALDALDRDDLGEVRFNLRALLDAVREYLADDSENQPQGEDPMPETEKPELSLEVTALLVRMKDVFRQMASVLGAVRSQAAPIETPFAINVVIQASQAAVEEIDAIFADTRVLNDSEPMMMTVPEPGETVSIQTVYSWLMVHPTGGEANVGMMMPIRGPNGVALTLSPLVVSQLDLAERLGGLARKALAEVRKDNPGQPYKLRLVRFDRAGVVDSDA